MVIRSALCAALVVLVTALPVMAADGLTPDAIGGGGSQDWIDRGNGGERISQLQLAFAYDLVLGDLGDYGLSVWQLISAAPGTDGSNENDWIYESSVVGWLSRFDGQLELFGGVSWCSWGENIMGTARSLVGPAAGFRFPLEFADDGATVLWFEAKGKYYMGHDGVKQYGVGFGPVFTIGS